MQASVSLGEAQVRCHAAIAAQQTVTPNGKCAAMRLEGPPQRRVELEPLGAAHPVLEPRLRHPKDAGLPVDAGLDPAFPQR